MATAKQRRKQRFKRKQHQITTSTGIRLKSYINGKGEKVEIELKRGGKDVGGHPPERAGHDARGLALRDLRSLGINNPAESTIREYQRLVKHFSGHRGTAKAELKKNLDDVLRQVQERERNQPEPKFEVIKPGDQHRGKTSSKIPADDVELYVDIEVPDRPRTDEEFANLPVLEVEDLNDIANGRDGRQPTEQEWDDLCAEAKRRKRGVRRTAEKAGWTLANSDLDGKSARDWLLP